MGLNKRQLRTQLDNALSEAYNASLARGVAEQRAETAETRLSAVLAIVMNGKGNLESLFGPLTNLGVDETDTYLRYAADDGLAQIQLNPATGIVLVQDPKNQVEGVKVGFDHNGDLSTKEQQRIQRFRADVTFLRQAGNTAVTGNVSLTARRDEVTDPTLASVRES